MTIAETTPSVPARTEATRPEDTAAAPILLTVLLLLVAWGTSVALWGIPGLYIPALAMVPVIWAVLIAISRG